MATSLISESDSKTEFYQQADKYLESLNVRFREKTVIKQEMNDKILRCLSNKYTKEFNSRFISWCRNTFVVQQIGTNVYLCDIKTRKRVLLYEMMYDIYKSIHIETAHGGRDKCLDALSLNYSWYNRQILQIYIKNCTSCQQRKAILKPMLSKPIIALEVLVDSMNKIDNEIQETTFTLSSSTNTEKNESRHEFSRAIARVNYLKSQNKRQKAYDDHIQKISQSFKNGDLVGISISKVDRTNCDPKIMPCVIEKSVINTNVPCYHLISPYGRLSTTFHVNQLIPMSGTKPTALQQINFQTIPTITFIQASKLFARGNAAATCDCKAKCLTKTCPCRRSSIACSTKCHAKLGRCMNMEE